MRKTWHSLCVVVLALAVAAVTVGAASPSVGKPRFRATLTAAGHRPKVVVKWFYQVRVTDLLDKPIHARITVQVKDPLGTIHPIQFGPSTKNIVNYPIYGSYRDWVNWPRSSAIGITLVFRVIVKTSVGTRLLTYWVSPRA